MFRPIVGFGVSSGIDRFDWSSLSCLCIGEAVMAWAEVMMRDEETSKYVDGMAFHWYFGGSQRLLDGNVGWNALERCGWVDVWIAGYP